VPVNWLTIRRFAEETGYSEQAIRSKIKIGVWLEGQVWLKAPDGRVLMSAKGYNSWVESPVPESAPSVRHPSKSPSPIKEPAVAKKSNLSPLPLT
jgi:hypothetical protein